MKNIAIIVIDALRARNLSLFGYQKETDKNLKEIAKESLVFRNFFSVTNSTFPTITSLFSGKYPPSHGIMHQAPYASPEEYGRFLSIEQPKFWLPRYLKEKGYHTIGIDWIGLWFKEGFDYYGDEGRIKFKHPKLKAIMRKILFRLPSAIYKIGKKIKKTKLFASSKESVNLAIEKIMESKELKKPFFLFMHLEDPHFPFPNIKNPKPSGKEDIDKLLKKIKSPSQRDYMRKRIVDISLKSVQDIKNKYDLAIKTVDKEIGRL
ncbi:sulfatase-like hydrolase/transferase, partial [Candidatus Pacearchaeota archaeon]|nr:sulfatase-like hydrolase/transferase [Candidatus Pacearchaeota archaeon]